MADKELSADDLREKLFHTFQSRGVLESLKSQLRNRLVTELQQTAKANLANGKRRTPEEPLLFYHAANSLVVDHLEKCNFDYTLSVFLPESGTSKDKAYSVKDLLHLLKVDKDSHLFKSLECTLSNKINSKSFLWEIVSQFSSLCGHNKHSTSVQTDECDSIKSPSVAEKLKFVERAFSGKEDSDSEGWAVRSEQKVIDFQRKCEERKKAELSLEIQRFRASELSRMRLEEKEQCQKAIKMAKEQMEKDYFLKTETLRLKEKELTEREDRHKKIQEEEAYTQRQKILDDLQTMKERENDLKRRQELQERSLQIEEEKVKAEAEKLKEKAMTLKEEETRVKQKIEDEIQRYKLQHQESYQNRLHDLELREVQFKQDKESFDRSKTLYLGYYDELEGKKEQLRQFQSQLEVSKYNITSLQEQKDALVQRLQQVKDYDSIKNSQHTLQIEKAELQRLFDEEKSKEKAYKATIKELKDKLSKPSAVLASAENELKTVKEDMKNKERLTKEMQRKWELRLQQESQRCIEYQRLYEESLLRQKEMERESEDLRAALHHTQTLLRMELERRRFSEASVSDVSLTSPPAEKTLVKAECPGRSRENSDRNTIMNDTGSTQELIANSKEVFDKLEKDAKDLEESYRRFQSRMKNTGLDQFTSVHPNSLDNNNAPNCAGTRTDAATGSVQDKANSQDNFVPLSWVPISGNKGLGVPISHIGNTHVLSSGLDPTQALRPFTREDKPDTASETRFYSLPSFGVSELTQNTPAPRYFGLSNNTRRPPNNTVNVSDLIAKPGSPSIISAPIDHSSIPSTSTETIKTKQNNNRLGYSSEEAPRRPLSSTIGRGNIETGELSRDTGFPTSKNSTQTSHLPVIDGSVVRGRKSDTESENESHRSSDASLSGGYLSIGTLNKPAKILNSNHREQEYNSSKDENDKTDGPISLDGAWSGRQTNGGLQQEERQITLDSVWKSKPEKNDLSQNEGLEKSSQERERNEREREKREREEREWEEEKRKREEQRIRRETEAWEREQRELAELQRQQELHEHAHANLAGQEEHISHEVENQKDESPKQEDTKPEHTDPDIDPVMLQYMQMIQKKKHDEQQVKVTESVKKDKMSKDAADSQSNSLFSQGDEGSLDDLSGDDGFDWG